MLGGYFNRILEVNLSSGQVKILELGKLAYNYLGGRGVASKLLYDRVPRGVNPLSPENDLVFMTGPLTGTGFPGSGRICVASKSPLTKTIFPSSVGGSFGVFLKSTGLDGIVLKGRASKPVYLLVQDGEVRLEDATDLWGKSTQETEEILKKRHPHSGIAEIGPAGENLSPLACIMSETRAAGRGGLGAVAGSKNLKAIVVTGKQRVKIAHEEAFKKIAERIRKSIESHPISGKDGSLSRFGTAMLVHRITAAGILPVRDFSGERVDFSQVDGFSGETIREKFFVRRKGCFACSTACGRVVKVGDKEVKGPEYESIVMLGPNSDFWDYEKEILPLSLLCDELGMDTISTGVILGWARKNGKIRTIAEAFEFVKELSKKFEPPSGLAEVKGLGLPAYDPRGVWGMALAYATSTRGACHLQAYVIGPEILSIPEFVNPATKIGKARLVRRMQDAFAVFDSLVLCKYYFPAIFTSLEFELDELAELLTALTGWRWTGAYLHEVGSRIFNTERLFNIREGFGPAHDRLPERFGMDLSHLLLEYYRERGWSDEGIPSPIPERDPVLAEKIELPVSPLEKLHPPELQVALDLDADVGTIVEIAREAYEGGARIVEAGTPAIKRHGTETLLPALRSACPDAIIVADLKTMDVGNLEARIAFRNGADIVAVMGIGGKAKIFEALSEASRREKAILIDLLDCPNPIQEIERLSQELADPKRVAFCLHRGISEQMKGRGIYEQGQLIREAKRKAGNFLLFVAGGIKAGVAGSVVRAGADVCIVGSAIYNSADPRDSARRILEEMRTARSQAR
jgi:aldehyde:ferredoxin oxidoreductase